MSAQMGGQPVYILSEGVERYRGRDARNMNILASRVVAEAVKSTLGPKGMDKMLVDTTGDVVITNDGAAILKEVEIKHPAAKMMVEIAKTQEMEVGDGTTTVVVLAGELLKRTEELLDQDVHATLIAKGFRLAEERALEVLGKMAKKVKGTESELKQVALTSLSSKAPGVTAKGHIADLAVAAVKEVAEKREGKVYIDKDDIKIQKQSGESTSDSSVIQGVVLDKELANPGMPTAVKNAKIVLANVEMKIKKTETDAKLDISSPEQLEAFMKGEEDALRKMAKNIADSGANVFFCQKSIDDAAIYFLTKENILAAKSISEKDLKLLSKATGATIITNYEDIKASDLGKAELVENKKVSGKEFIFIEGCPKPKAVTIFLRGGSEHVLDEAERSMDDAICVVRNVLQDSHVLPGGGASAAEVAKELRKHATKIGGREQLAIQEFAKSLEVIPRTLAENAGLDPIDTLLELRTQHEKGNADYGIDIATGKSKDMYKSGVVDSMRVVKQAIRSATEVAIMVLRIDDVIATKGALGGGEEMPPMPPGGMEGMEGMGGMPPMM
ncbi:MAG: thermosome subunit alpha [Candidatus Hydrothermarchaeaceae archaeon]